VDIFDRITKYFENTSWIEAAKELNGTYQKGDFYWAEKLYCQYKHWEIIVDCSYRNKKPCTRFQLHFISPDKFTLQIQEAKPRISMMDIFKKSDTTKLKQSFDEPNKDSDMHFIALSFKVAKKSIKAWILISTFI